MVTVGTQYYNVITTQNPGCGAVTSGAVSQKVDEPVVVIVGPPKPFVEAVPLIYLELQLDASTGTWIE